MQRLYSCIAVLISACTTLIPESWASQNLEQKILWRQDAGYRKILARFPELDTASQIYQGSGIPERISYPHSSPEHLRSVAESLLRKIDPNPDARLIVDSARANAFADRDTAFSQVLQHRVADYDVHDSRVVLKLFKDGKGEIINALV